MPDKKLTDNEIKKALDVCVGIQNDCGDCPLLEYSQASDECMTELMSNALDLINRLQAENEALRPFGTQVEVSKKLEAEIKAEAYKECAEKIKQKTLAMIYSPDEVTTGDYISCIDDVVKELTEKSN